MNSKLQEKADIHVLQEVIRQSEVRLSAQLQTKLSYESRILPTMTFLIALFSILLTIRTYISTNSDKTMFTPVSIFLLFNFVSLMFGLPAILISTKWYYVGARPDGFITYIETKKPHSTLSKIFNRVLQKKLGTFKTSTFQTAHQFKEVDLSLDHLLHNTAVAYNESILRNEKTLKTIAFSANYPVRIVLLGFYISGVWTVFYPLIGKLIGK